MLDDMFYWEDELATFKYEAFMEKAGLNVSDFESINAGTNSSTTNDNHNMDDRSMMNYKQYELEAIQKQRSLTKELLEAIKNQKSVTKEQEIPRETFQSVEVPKTTQKDSSSNDNNNMEVSTNFVPNSTTPSMMAWQELKAIQNKRLLKKEQEAIQNQKSSEQEQEVPTETCQSVAVPKPTQEQTKSVPEDASESEITSPQQQQEEQDIPRADEGEKNLEQVAVSVEKSETFVEEHEMAMPGPAGSSDSAADEIDYKNKGIDKNKEIGVVWRRNEKWKQTQRVAGSWNDSAVDVIDHKDKEIKDVIAVALSILRQSPPSALGSSNKKCKQKQRVSFSDSVDTIEIPALDDTVLDDSFYWEEELAAFRYEALMEKVALRYSDSVLYDSPEEIRENSAWSSSKSQSKGPESSSTKARELQSEKLTASEGLGGMDISNRWGRQLSASGGLDASTVSLHNIPSETKFFSKTKKSHSKRVEDVLTLSPESSEVKEKIEMPLSSAGDPRTTQVKEAKSSKGTTQQKRQPKRIRYKINYISPPPSPRVRTPWKSQGPPDKAARSPILMRYMRKITIPQSYSTSEPDSPMAKHMCIQSKSVKISPLAPPSPGRSPSPRTTPRKLQASPMPLSSPLFSPNPSSSPRTAARARYGSSECGSSSTLSPPQLSPSSISSDTVTSGPLSMAALKYSDSPRGRAMKTHKVEARAMDARHRLSVKRKSAKAVMGRLDKTSHVSSFTRDFVSSFY